MMKHNGDDSDVTRKYAKAYAVHHSIMDLHEALGLYREIMARYQDTMEARNADSQIQSIVTLLVPAQSHWDAQYKLARFEVDTPGPPNGRLGSN